MRVAEKSPAEEGGLKSGDLIVSIDGEPATGVDDLLRLLNHERVGKEVKLVVLRRGELRERFVIPAERL
jgi:S1-C subfamily serine protease